MVLSDVSERHVTIMGCIICIILACTKEYKLYSGKKIAGGTIITAVNSLDACKTWCNNKPECAGFDFNANSCWWMTKTSPIVNANDGADHYSKNTKCGG